jgi:ribosomal protein S18 acetylase RimI-like enzyme
VDGNSANETFEAFLPRRFFYDMMRCVNANSIHIRKGRNEDLPALTSFTRKTFTWGDYIAEAWTHWVESPRGELLVAEVNGAFAGTAHVRYLENREAWLEGVRVHPAFRRRSVATTLIQTAHARAKKKHCRTMRLETGSKNRNARRLFEALGYRLVVEYARYRARASGRVSPALRAAKVSDAAACWAIWETSLRGHRVHALTRAPFGWRWWEFSPARLRAAIRAGEVWLSLDGRAFMAVRRDDEFQILALAGSQHGMTHLLQGAQDMARQQKTASVYWFTPNTAHALRLAAQNRFTLDDAGMLIYEYVF